MEQDQAEKRIISLPYRVPYADTDKMGVVYYANYFVYFERLRNELFRESGVSYVEIEESGLLFPVAEAFCDYHRSAKYDDLITIDGWVEWVEGSRVRIGYRIHCNGEALVTGYTIHVVINTEGKPRRVPESLKTLLS